MGYLEDKVGMNFEEALKYAKDGVKIKRKGWQEVRYLCMQPMFVDQNGSMTMPSMEDMFADDWCVC